MTSLTLMPLIRCTQKLQKEMGLNKSDLSVQDSDPGTLGAWHANLLYINRRKCVIFVNDKTLLNFTIPDLKREQLRRLDTLFKNWLCCILAEEGLDESLRESIMQEYEHIGYAATASRSVIGCMNDLVFHYKIHLESQGGVHSAMLPQIIQQLNRMPMKVLNYGYPIDALFRLYDIQQARKPL